MTSARPEVPKIRKPETSRFPSTLAAASCAALLLAVAPACRRNAATPPPPPPLATVAHPIEREVIEWDDYTGRLEATETVEVRARVSGLVMSVPFEEGALVHKGDLLAEIDVQPYQAELNARLAAIEQAEAEVQEAEIEYHHIEQIPPESRTSTEFEEAQAKLSQTRAALSMAKAQADTARLNVEWCRITSPLTGRASRRYVDAGNYITGGSGTGTLLTTIVSVDPIYCFVDVDEQSVLKYARLAREGKRVSARQARIPCFLQLSDEEGFPHEGIIDFVDNRIDPATGTIRARGVFANSDGWLLPGLFGRLRVPGSGRYRATLVPDAAVTTDQNQKVLLVVDSESTVRVRPVKLGALFGEFRGVESGLQPDERVVVNGLLNARPGAKVTIRETTLSMESYQLTAPGSPTTQALPATRNTADGAPPERMPVTQPSSRP